MNLTADTCARVLNAAAMNRKQAIQLELAVGLAVFQLHGNSGKDARTMLMGAYSAAGYRCTHINEMDYKTINRRVNATAALFEKLPVAAWVGKLNDADAIKSICIGLEPYELFTISDVQGYCNPAKRRAPRARVEARPHVDILAGPSGHEKVIEQFRRAADTPVRTVSTEHLTLAIPSGTPREEIIDMASQLLALAKENNKELLTT
jgi:hypothetical protein